MEIIKELFSIRSEFSFFFHSVMPKQLESESEVTQLCPTLCDPMGCSPPGSSVHGILQARVLEQVAIPFSRDQIQVFLTQRLTRSPALQADSLLSEPLNEQRYLQMIYLMS